MDRELERSGTDPIPFCESLMASFSEKTKYFA
jgi:hypothetical protein